MPSPDSPQSVPADGDGVGTCDLVDGNRVREDETETVAHSAVDDGEGESERDFEQDAVKVAVMLDEALQ